MTAVTKVKPTVKKAQQVKKVSNYKKIVLDTNSNLKKFTKSTGGSIKIILLLDNLEPRLKKVLRAIQKDDVMYNQLDKS